ncbi:MAG: branched-chain amino acid ABC transporter permease [Chloroflexota bacterium]|nr:branched-chain amino acid ABC transporter permease [Chloroflexota bacterium]
MLLAVALVAVAPVWLEAQQLSHIQHVLILIGLYATLAAAWNVLGGYAGQVSLGNAVFFGVGAYVPTLLVIRLGLTPWLGLLAGVLLAVALGLVIGYYTFHLGGHYFAIATIAVGEIVQTSFINWKDVGGAAGLSQPLLPSALINFQFASRMPYLYTVAALAGIALLATVLMERSRLGFYFRAIRNDPLAARCLGVDITRYKLVALAISAALTAAGGTFYAQYVLFVDPESTLSLRLSVLIVLVAVLGGVGTVWGPLLGAAVLIPLSEGTRVYLASAAGGGRAIDLMIYGLLIIMITLFRPGGLVALARSGRNPAVATGAAGQT